VAAIIRIHDSNVTGIASNADVEVVRRVGFGRASKDKKGERCDDTTPDKPMTVLSRVEVGEHSLPFVTRLLPIGGSDQALSKISSERPPLKKTTRITECFNEFRAFEPGQVGLHR
jgi:hypothetical protein